MKKYIVCCAASLLLITSCGKSPQKARQELTKIGIEFTGKAFENAVIKKDKIAIDLFLDAEHDASFVLTAAIMNYASGEDKNIDLIKELINNSSNANIVQPYGTPLKKAISFENEELIKLLLKKGANPNFNDGEALKTALLHKENFKLSKLLIDNGADINIKNKRGSLLYESILLNKPEIAKYLLDRGAEVNDGSNGNSDSLIVAIGKKDKELIETLLQKGANIDSTWQNPNDIALYWGGIPRQYTLYEIAKGESEIIAILDKYSKKKATR